MYLPPQGKEIDDDACLSQVNSLKEPGFHLECVVHREEAQNHFCVVHGCTLIQCSDSTLPLWHKPPGGDYGYGYGWSMNFDTPQGIDAVEYGRRLTFY